MPIEKTERGAVRKEEMTGHMVFINEAIKEAREGLAEGGEPIGSVLVREGEIIGRGRNRRVQDNNPIRHAEMAAIENAGRLPAEEYRKCVLYSTLSPCDMCSGAALLYKIPLIVIAENENFKGPEEYLEKRGVKIINLGIRECAEMMRRYIKENEKTWFEDIGE